MIKSLKISKPATLLTSLLLVSSMLFSACGTKETSSTPAPSTKAAETAAAASTPAALPEVKLSWYFPGGWPQPDQDQVFAEFNKILKAKINATVDFKPLSFGDYDQKMKVIIASGEPYDLNFTSNWLNNYTQNVAKGAYLPLDDLLPKYAPKAFASVPKTFWEATKVNGKIYGFINQQISARTPDVVVLKSVADKYNLDLKSLSGKFGPDNLKALEPFLASVHKEEPQRAFITSLSQYNEAMGYEAIAGFNVPGVVNYDDSTIKVVNQFETSAVKTFAALMRDWNTKGYLNSQERISKKTDDGNDFSKVAITIGGAYKPGVDVILSNQAKQQVIDVPAGAAHLSTGGIVATMHAISRTSKNPERAMMLLELLNTDKELFNLINFGFKDKHYKLDADGFKTPADGSKGYSPAVDWMFATNYLAYVDKGMPATVWEDTKKVNNDAVPSKLLGFTFDAEPVKAEIGKTSAVYDEYYRAIDLGVATEAKYNEFVAKLKDAGSEKIIAEMQKQIDAWKAAKK